MTKLDMSFIKDFDKELSKMDGIGTSSLPPRYWYSTGNHVLNRIISGSFARGIPQGRVNIVCGDSGSGKSFLGANMTKSAQSAGAYCLVIDSENALDDEFMSKIGVDVNDGYKYVGVKTISQVINVVSSFLKGYKKSVGNDPDAPQIFILIDSLDMLMTDTELVTYDKGDQKGDQGQRNKQLKAMLRTFVQDIKQLNVTMLCVSQVYKNQDLLNGLGPWIVSDAVKYACSQIILLSKLKLKDESGKSGQFAGIRMKCEGYKTRFTKPFQTVTLEIPYETGMDPYSGLLEVAVGMGVVEKRGSRYAMHGQDQSWFEKDWHPYIEQILINCEELTNTTLKADIDDLEIVTD
jgi:recombination protein RecA